MRGVPFRIEIGPRDLKNNAVTLVRRDGVKESVPMDGLPQTLINKLVDFQASLLKKASDFMFSRIRDCSTLDEAKVQVDSGFARMYWCGEKACGLEMENVTGGKLLGEPQGMAGAGACPVCGKAAGHIVLVSRSY
jgi:prolyl-tRNA synthetase